MLKIKIAKLNSNAIIPEYKTVGAAGADLYSVDDVEIQANDIALIPTGLKIEIPDGYEIQIRPRSGMALKKITVLNSPGTIDADYRGEIKIILFNANNTPVKITAGSRVAQMVIAPVVRADFEIVNPEDLSTTERDKSGFGSTGK